MDELSEIYFYDGEYTGPEIDEAVGAALYPDSTPDATHTNALITSAAVAGVMGGMASISITGTTNDTGATIPAGTYFYVSGTLCVAKTDIANGATLTSGTNYEAVTAGGLNALRAAINELDVPAITLAGNASKTFTVPTFAAGFVATARSTVGYRSLAFVTWGDAQVLASNASITFSVSSGTLTVTNGTADPISVFILNFNSASKITAN